MTSVHNHFELIYNQQHNVFIINYAGVVKVKTLMRMVDEVVNHKDFDARFNILHDFLQANLDLLPVEMNQLKQYVRSIIPGETILKTAVVAEEDLAQILADIYRTSGDSTPYEEMEIFSNLDDAIAWLDHVNQRA